MPCSSLSARRPEQVNAVTIVPQTVDLISRDGRSGVVGQPYHFRIRQRRSALPRLCGAEGRLDQAPARRCVLRPGLDPVGRHAPQLLFASGRLDGDSVIEAQAVSKGDGGLSYHHALC